ncbi:MAG TPA: DUF4154 domain-containing protein [Cytophagales bacterium]|jgi:glutamine amidotransferase PdxT|nr:DUF4154 domain-containing protein [Cytophagales bacterium]
MFIYNFTKYIQWPSRAIQNDFVIGVMGKHEIFSELEGMAATKKMNGKSLKVQVFDDAEQIGKCHILFIPDGKSKHLEEILAKTSNQNTLIIAERNGLTKEGSAIHFIVVNRKLNLELDRAAADKANLKVSGDLAKLAILV